MPLTLAALVLLSAALHPVWNVLIKRDASPAGAFLILGTTLVGVGVAHAVASGVALWPAAEVWPLLLASAAGQAVYGTALAVALRRGDLSAYYPVVRAAPVAVVAWGWLAQGQSYGWPLLLGIALVLAGGFLLQARPGRRLDDPVALAAAVVSMLGSAVYSVADGQAMRLAAPELVLVWAQGMALPVELLAFHLAGMPVRAGGARGWLRGAAAGVIAYASYYLILLVYQLGGSVAAVTSVRQASIPLSVLMGALWLGEGRMAGRLGASLVVAAGIVLIVVNR
jgi:drug/metabolite transporter (DMT)-like permease